MLSHCSRSKSSWSSRYVDTIGVSHMCLVSMLIGVPNTQLLVAFECVYVLGIACVKLAFLWMYMRIFPLRNFKIASYIVGSITIAWAIAIILFSIFQCQPIRKAWLGPAIPGRCGNLKASFIGNGTKATAPLLEYFANTRIVSRRISPSREVHPNVH